MGKNTDAIVLLAAGIKQDQAGRWISTEFSAADNELGAPGGKLRIHAVSILARQNPDAIIVTGGNKGFDVHGGLNVDRPIIAEILRDELLDCGIAEDRLLLDHNSNTTYQNLQELEQMDILSRFENITIVTNRYHLPRLLAIIEEKFPHWKERAKVGLVAAEDVLIAHEEKRWREFIDDAYKSEWMAKRIKMETQGVMQIRSQTYKFR